jgi:2-oxoisovalerate dehydrogenase E1 component alpha subunit
MEVFLERQGFSTAAELYKIQAELDAEVSAVIEREEPAPPPPIESLIEDVFEQPPWHLREQLAAITDPDS